MDNENNSKIEKMEKESNSKIQELEEKLDAVGIICLKQEKHLDKIDQFNMKQEKDGKKLKKRQPKKMTAMKFVGVAFDPEKYKAGEAEINDALANGFEVLRDFETGGGIVMALGKWEKKDEKVKNGWTK